MTAVEVAEGQVWEKDGRRVRVVWVSAGEGPRRSVNVRDVENQRFSSFRAASELVAEYRYVGNPLSDEVVLFRLTDLIRRTGVSDADRLIDALEGIVRSRRAAA
jgi:hypothetical protein